MEIFDLRAFARTIKAPSLSAAARSLKLPKSSVSRALTRLEAAVGAVLIERSTRHLRLTDAGAMLLPHARRILDATQAAQAALDGLAEVPRGTLKISVTHSFAVGVLTPMLSAFMKRHPAVRVVLDISNRMVDLVAEGIDLAICIGLPADSALIARRLAAIELWVCASPAYLRERGTPKFPRDLVEHQLLTRADRVLPWRFYSVAGRPSRSKFCREPSFQNRRPPWKCSSAAAALAACPNTWRRGQPRTAAWCACWPTCARRRRRCSRFMPAA